MNNNSWDITTNDAIEKNTDKHHLLMLLAILFIMIVGAYELHSETSLKNSSFVNAACKSSSKSNLNNACEIIHKDGKISNQEYLVFVYLVDQELKHGKAL